MFIQALPSTVRANLALVAQTSLAEQFYLAGGTAVALHLGHRRSYNLDFFIPQRDFPPALPRQELASPDPMPEMLVPCRWGQVKRFFQNEVRRLMKELLETSL